MTHKEVCGGNDANPNPCANGGACRVNLDLQTPPFGYICDCADGWTGDNCQVMSVRLWNFKDGGS